MRGQHCGTTAPRTTASTPHLLTLPLSLTLVSMVLSGPFLMLFPRLTVELYGLAAARRTNIPSEPPRTTDDFRFSRTSSLPPAFQTPVPNRMRWPGLGRWLCSWAGSSAAWAAA